MSAETPLLYNITLKVVDYKCYGTVDSFNVPAKSGETLFDALTGYEQTQNKFKFQAKAEPNVGQYVNEVMGKKNGDFRFWEILLMANNDTIPINLDYQIFGSVTIKLYFALFGLIPCSAKK